MAYRLRKRGKKRIAKTGVWRRDDPDQTIIGMNDEMAAIILDQERRFKEKFGREMGPDDPVFFDPNSDTPKPINPEWAETKVVEAMQQVGIDPAYIYAYTKTGRLLTKENRELLTPEELNEWKEAVDEYHARRRQ
jgi:hypothetical protein